MNIGFSSFVLDGGKTGIATYVINLLKNLQEVDSRNHYEILLNERDADLIPIKGQNFRRKIYPSWINQPIVNIAWHNLALPILAKKNNYTLVHIPSIRRIPLIKGCRVIATIHDLAPLRFPEKYDRLRLFYHQKILTSLIHRADSLIAVSQHTKSDIVQLTGYPQEKIHVVYSGIDKTTFYPYPKKEASEKLKIKYGLSNPFIVYVSRIEHPAKNHMNLIKAFELFKKVNSSNVQLVLAGADWNGAHVVKEYALKSQNRNEIHFLGFVPTDDIVRLYSACELMVFPSFYEGFGFPVLEAMACGAPVICSNVSALKEIAEGYANLFDPDNIQQIAEAIEKGLLKEYREEMCEKAMIHVSHFDWIKTAQEVLKIYQSEF